MTTGGDHAWNCPNNPDRFSGSDSVTSQEVDVNTVPIFMSKGWECVLCGCIYAPWVPECWRCNKDKRLTYDTAEEMLEDLLEQ
jgi:hypothetical protein